MWRWISFLSIRQCTMSDPLTPAERSKRMSLIRSRDTTPEMQIRRALHSVGFRYRLHQSNLPGRPDLVFPSRKFVLFVNGCFWHGHSCNIGHIPKSNSAFWSQKILTNRKRDARNIRKLRAAGWKVQVVWECSLSPKQVGSTIARVSAKLIAAAGRKQASAIRPK